jgi:hypothetical protein
MGLAQLNWVISNIFVTFLNDNMRFYEQPELDNAKRIYIPTFFTECICLFWQSTVSGNAVAYPPWRTKCAGNHRFR